MKFCLFTKYDRWKCDPSLIHKLLTWLPFSSSLNWAYLHKIGFVLIITRTLKLYDLNFVRVKMKILLTDLSLIARRAVYSLWPIDVDFLHRLAELVRCFQGFELFLHSPPLVNPVCSTLFIHVWIALSDGRGCMHSVSKWHRQKLRVWIKFLPFLKYA